MEVKEVNFKRFVASEGMALKWKERRWSYLENKFVISDMWSINSAVIDLNNVVKEVEEVTMKEYEEGTKCCAVELRRH